MKRIDNASAVDGLFTDGDPVQAIPATVLPAKWLNDIQEEVCGFVESRGMTLDGNDQDQLRKAIENAVSQGITPLHIAIANNQAVAADVTGVVFDKTKVKLARMTVSMYRKTDSGKVEEFGDLYARYDEGDDAWSLHSDLLDLGDESGVTLSISATGQLQYTSTNMAGTNYVGKLRIAGAQVLAI